MNTRIHRNSILVASLLLSLLTIHLDPVFTRAQNSQAQNQAPPAPPTLGLDQGYIDLDTPDFTLRLVKASQTVAALQPKSGSSFDFTPADRLDRRAANGYHHLGDLTLRVRAGNAGTWQKYDTAEARKAVQALPALGQTLAIADLAATLPADITVQIIRAWSIEDGH